MSKPFNYAEFVRSKGSRAPHTTKAKIYLVDKTDQIEALNEQADDAALKDIVGDKRMSSKSSVRKIQKQIEALQAEMEDGAVEFTFRKLRPDEYNEIQNIAEDDPKHDTRYDQLAMQSRSYETQEPLVEGAMTTPEQWQEYANSGEISIADFILIVTTATAISMESVSVPKASPNISEALKASQTSQS